MNENSEFAMGLHLQCGIPVVTAQGGWDETRPALLTDILRRLASAGHCEIVIDLTALQCDRLLTQADFEALEQMASAMRLRRVRLGAVIGRAQPAYRRQRSLIRWAATEEEAICYLKGVPRASAGTRTAAHWNGA